MYSHIIISFIFFIFNCQVGCLFTLIPELSNDVIYFTREQAPAIKSDGKSHVLTRSSSDLKGADVARGAGDELLRSSGDSPAAPNPDPAAGWRSKRNTRAATDNVGNCGVTGDQINRIQNSKFHFNDTNINLALIWTGQSSKELLALTTLEYGFFASPSHLWLSLDYGRSFTNIDDRIEGAVIRRENGIFKSPLDSKRVILISYMSDMDTFGSKLYITKNGGRTFETVIVPFFPEGKIHFHPSNPDLLFVRTPTDEMKVWLSQDFGSTWNFLKSKIEQVSWASAEMDAASSLFLLQYKESGEGLNLLDTSNFGKSYQTIQEHVRNFGVQGKFIYAAIDSSKDSSDLHILHVSNDKGITWHPTQLPAITNDRFFSVLDMSEGLIFMHVDDPGNTGTGTIYTSASDGIVFSESLERHLFPNGGQITDFYRVDSMRGVYLASQMHADATNPTIHTMITYDRGAIWETIKKPVDSPCHDQGVCGLQIHNRYSQTKGIAFPSGPLSDSTATGLIMVHATVANALELRAPDVYVSSDGGYNWRQALVGPHHYTITNSGGLLVAISSSEEATDTVKFSYDEGQCWNSYKFSDEKITITGLLPEPSKKSLNVSIWGFGLTDNEWRSYMVNFGSILETECTDSDFVEWKPHEDNDQAGCLLGRKESFHRVRTDALCRVSFNFEQEPLSSTLCTCNKADYECDYGFYRPEDSEDCVQSPDYQNKELEYCENGHEEKLSSWGYRKVPGDVCEGGYQPQRHEEQLKAKCEGASKSKSHSAAVGIVVTLLVITLLVGVFVLYKKNKFTCIQRGMRTYQYSQLTQGDSMDSRALDLTDSMQGYHDDSDEDMLE